MKQKSKAAVITAALLTVATAAALVADAVFAARSGGSALPSPAPTASPTVSPTAPPTDTPVPTPTRSPIATATPAPTDTPVPTDTPGPTAVPTPTQKPGPTKTPGPTRVPSTPRPQTPAPVPVSHSHEIEGAVPESAAADASYFDSAVFIGDSVSLKLNYYEASKNVLGQALFLTSGSFSTVDALSPVTKNSIHPKYQGKKQLLEDSVAQSGKKRVYIMLGMNDIGRRGHTLEQCAARMEQVCDRILEKSPDAQIYIESMTPIASATTLKGITNDKIFSYNQLLCALCTRRGWHFINVSSVLYDSNGYLNKAYCSDWGGMGIHFTNEGCAAWVQYLYTHSL